MRTYLVTGGAGFIGSNYIHQNDYQLYPKIIFEHVFSLFGVRTIELSAPLLKKGYEIIRPLTKYKDLQRLRFRFTFLLTVSKQNILDAHVFYDFYRNEQEIPCLFIE